MQNSANAVRIHLAALSGNARQVTTGSQLTIDSWVLRDWSMVALNVPNAYALPTTPYTLVGSASGDVVKKSGVA
jgi:hypothetical protein